MSHATESLDASTSRPEHRPTTRLCRKREHLIISLRFNRQWGACRISYHLSIPRSTVERVLIRCRMPKVGAPMGAALSGDAQTAERVELELPETGFCSTDLGSSCDAPVQEESSCGSARSHCRSACRPERYVEIRFGWRAEHQVAITRAWQVPAGPMLRIRAGRWTGAPGDPDAART